MIAASAYSSTSRALSGDAANPSRASAWVKSPPIMRCLRLKRPTRRPAAKPARKDEPIRSSRKMPTESALPVVCRANRLSATMLRNEP